ncbi:MAG: NUDIX domain-containing protein [Patescibacteria group bacterium]
MLEIILKLATIIRKLYWRLARPVTIGARAILVNPQGQVLLVRHRYDERWYLPGGAGKRDEAAEATLRRELREELGISEFSYAAELSEYLNQYEHKKDTITVFVIKAFTFAPTGHFEIGQWSFFDPCDLPDCVSSGTRRRIEEWLDKRAITSAW